MTRQKVSAVLPLILLFAIVLTVVSVSTPAGAKDGKSVSVVINGDGGPSANTAALKSSAISMLCLSFPSATAAKVAIKGQSGSKTVKCSKIRSSATGKDSKSASDADGTRKDPIPVGQSADVGDGWTIKVTNVVADAYAVIAAENQFNDPPAPGQVFFLVRLEATYNGKDATSNTFSMDFSAVDDGDVSYNTYSCGVIPEDLGGFDDIFQGGTISGNVCWAVDANKTASLVMYIETGFSRDPVFFALA